MLSRPFHRDQRVLVESKSPGSLSPLKRPGTTRVPNRPVFRVVCQANFPIRKIVFGVSFFVGIPRALRRGTSGNEDPCERDD